MRALNDEEFAAARDYLAAEAGLVFDGSRRAALTAVLAERLRSTGTSDVTGYLAALRGQNGATERQRLIDGVTVQETHFFRNPPQVEALRRRLLPELLRRAAGRSRPLTIWSAGCSTGEEPYTIAMMLLELSPMTRERAGVQILGTDVSADALRAAARATYAGRTLDHMPAVVRDRWLEPRPGSAYAVKDRVRRMVDLQLHNLVTDPAPFGPGEVDLVLCRNVTIYFGRETTSRLVGGFHDLLAEGGYLVLGHSETLWQLSDAFTLVPVGGAFVYRRTHDARRDAPPGRTRPGSRTAAPATAGDRASALAPAPAVGRASARVVRPRSRPAAPPPDARALLAQARSQLVAGRYDGAAQCAELALAADPLLAHAYVVLGQARSTLGQDADAVDPLRKAVYLDPTLGAAHFLLAGALSRLGQAGPAAVSYRAAARTLPAMSDTQRAELLGGRAVAELVALCEQLARESTGAADDMVVSGGGG